MIDQWFFRVSHSLKALFRFADCGIWKPHWCPDATFRSSVGTFGQLVVELPVPGHDSMTFWNSGYRVISLTDNKACRVTHTRVVSAQATPEYVVPKSIETTILRSLMIRNLNPVEYDDGCCMALQMVGG
jgi:hypothetical protein